MNFLIEILLIFFSILVTNGIIYSLTLFNNTISSENISVRRNSSAKDQLELTLLMASNPLRIISSDSTNSEASSVSSLETSTSETLSVSSSMSTTSSERNVSWDVFDSEDIIDSVITQTQNFNLNVSNTPEGTGASHINGDIFDHTTSLDSITVLNPQTLEQLREARRVFYDFPWNTPAGILQDFKMDEINILYSQDIIEFGISQTELRLIIELIPTWKLFAPDVNHLILTIMSYYHC